MGKLYLNFKKNKYMIFYAMNTKIDDLITTVKIDGIPIERVSNLNILGLTVNEHMSWKSHIDIIANKLNSIFGHPE